MNKKSRNTGERLEFESFSNVTVEHLHRYSIALKIVKNKKVLDIASGEGYGSMLLAQTALEVIGVDIDIQSVEIAQSKYQKNNLKYIHGSTSKIPLESSSVDVVISFETIEHHDEHEQMMLEIKRVLKSDGLLLISSPDKKHYSDLPNYQNPFHVKELYCEEFASLVSKYFKYHLLFYQNSYNYNSYITETIDQLVVFSGDNSNIYNDEFSPIYNIILASDISQIHLGTSIFNGEKISEKIIEVEKNKIYNSNSYRVGNVIVKFLKYFRFKIKDI